MPLTSPQLAAVQLGVSAVPSIIQGIQGIKQNKMANDMLKNIHRPTLGVPTAETEALNVARNMASSFSLPNQYQAEQALNQEYAGGINNAVNTASSSAEALAASVALGGNRMNSQTQLAGNAANNYLARNQNLQSMLGDYADWQQKAWDWNVGGKYLQDAATASALKQAGQTNMFNAVSNLAGGVANSLPAILGDEGDGEGAEKSGGKIASIPIKSKEILFPKQQQSGIITPSLPTNNTSPYASTPNIGDFGYQVFGQGANMPTWNNSSLPYDNINLYNDPEWMGNYGISSSAATRNRR